MDKTDLDKIRSKFNEELDSLDSFKDGNFLDGEDYGDFVYSISKLLVLGQCIKEINETGETNFTTRVLEV